MNIADPDWPGGRQCDSPEIAALTRPPGPLCRPPGHLTRLDRSDSRSGRAVRTSRRPLGPGTRWPQRSRWAMRTCRTRSVCQTVVKICVWLCISTDGRLAQAGDDITGDRAEFGSKDESNWPNPTTSGLDNVFLLNGVTIEEDEEYGPLIEIEGLNGFLNQFSTVATQRRLR